MHELAHGGAIRSRMHSDPQCRVNALIQQGKKVVDGGLSHPMRWIHSALLLTLPSVSMSTRISLEPTPRFSIDSVLMKQLSTYFSPPS